MAKVLILLLLLAGLGLYVRRQQQHNYGMARIATPAGEAFDALTLPDDCSRGQCIKRYGYLTRAADTVALKAEALRFLTYVGAQHSAQAGPLGVSLLAVEPGFLRMMKPRKVVALAYGRLTNTARWEYFGLDDVTAQVMGQLN